MFRARYAETLFLLIVQLAARVPLTCDRSHKFTCYVLLCAFFASVGIDCVASRSNSVLIFIEEQLRLQGTSRRSKEHGGKDLHSSIA